MITSLRAYRLSAHAMPRRYSPKSVRLSLPRRTNMDAISPLPAIEQGDMRCDDDENDDDVDDCFDELASLID